MNTPRKDVPLMWDMELRDYFAALAMQGLISNTTELDRIRSGGWRIDTAGSKLAEAAYSLANDMLKARLK